ncbi:MAG: flagellar type III secretion system pore protein FliP [Planctomycetaceae bacterium]
MSNGRKATRDKRPASQRSGASRVLRGLRWFGVLTATAAVLLATSPGNAQNRGRDGVGRPGRPVVDRPGPPGGNARDVARQVAGEDVLSPDNLPSTMKVMLLLTVLSLAPSILMMTTCFIRFVIVFGLLRQALGTQQLPPNQVVVSLCLFLTFLVMSPVWKEAYEKGVKPYTHKEPIPGLQRGEDKFDRALTNTLRPLRKFMSDQIEMTGNSDAVWMFLEFQHRDEEGPLEQKYKTYDQVPISALLPAFMLSELKTAFVIGFQVYLPFLVIDLVVASVLISMGMMMLPPVLISLPFKILLFVLIDGWFLTVGMLLESIRPFG